MLSLPVAGTLFDFLRKIAVVGIFHVDVDLSVFWLLDLLVPNDVGTCQVIEELGLGLGILRGAGKKGRTA